MRVLREASEVDLIVHSIVADAGRLYTVLRVDLSDLPGLVQSLPQGRIDEGSEFHRISAGQRAAQLMGGQSSRPHSNFG